MHSIRSLPNRFAFQVPMAAALGLALLWAFALPGAVLGQEPWQAPPEYDGYANPIKADGDSIAKGKAVYLKNCFLCHGEKGDGKGPSAGTMPVKPSAFTDKMVQSQSEGSLAFKILSGRGPMPAWAPILQEDEVWNVINYIRQFGK